MIFDTYNNRLEKFVHSFYDANQNDFENWERLFHSIEIWKTKYLADSRKFTLSGVTGWYWDFSYVKFIGIKDEDYIPMISFLCWYMDLDKEECDSYKNQKFLDSLQTEILLEADSLTHLTTDCFLEELSDQYQRSCKRFETYVEDYGRANQKVVEELTPQYPRFLNFFQELKNDLQECKIVRINDWGQDENVWYFIEDVDDTHVIRIQDFV